MALIVETGANIENANSFVTRAELIAYGAARGVVLVDDGTTDILAIKAMDYIVSLRPRFKGYETYTDPAQTLPFPRKAVYVYGAYLPDDIIPTDLKTAQMSLALQVKAGVDLLPTNGPNSAAFVTREKVDVIETEYSEAVRLAMSNYPIMPLIESLLSQYLENGFGLLRTRRV